MNTKIDSLKNVWVEGRRTTVQNTALPKLDFEGLISSILSVGPFYYYIVDFVDMSLSHVSPSIYDVHGLNPNTVSFDDILNTIHPDDMEFVSQAEAASIDFLYNTSEENRVLKYKTNYSFRSRMKDGNYELLNHQAIVLSVDESGGFGKSLNIHTCINHLSKTNTSQVSIIGIKGSSSRINIDISKSINATVEFSKRELDVLKLMAEGNTNNEIATQLFISPLTVKKHRTNILQKSNCKNTSQLISECILKGLI